MIKAHGLRFYETELSGLQHWLFANSGVEIMDIKYTISEGKSYVVVFYKL